jgi:hypothetical protein
MRIILSGIFFIGFFLNSLIVRPGEVDITLARKVAKNFYAEKSRLISTQVLLRDDYTLLFRGTIVAYVFNLNDGFIIISGHDAVFPVLAYSFESDYPDNDFPPAFDFWMENYKSQIMIAINQNRESVKSIREIWEKYSDKNFFSKELLTEVQPLIHTTWNQGCYYNSYFPEDSTAPCGHLYTGCVATAMGQIMKFYNFPKNGTGSYGYNSSYGYVSADFENTEYGWTTMNFHLTDEDSTVAQLLFHCAIGIHSQFFPNGTGAYDFDVRDALVDYFNYSENAHFYWRDSYPGDWKAMLRAELDEGRPLIYGGADSQTNAGHTLVCDGYQDTSFFHFNWGWNGAYNGYFYLDSLIAGNNYFDFQHDAVVGIRPDLENIIIYPPLNIQVSALSSVVTVTWLAPELPSNLELLGYNVFRNGVIINQEITTGLSFIDMNTSAGWQQYTVSAVYVGGEKISGEIAEVFVEGSATSEFSQSKFTIYPNPASDYLCIRNVQGSFSDFKLTLDDLTGRRVVELDQPAEENSEIKIPLSEIAAGVYLLNIKSDEERVARKIVVR